MLLLSSCARRGRARSSKLTTACPSRARLQAVSTADGAAVTTFATGSDAVLDTAATAKEWGARRTAKVGNTLVLFSLFGTGFLCVSFSPCACHSHSRGESGRCDRRRDWADRTRANRSSAPMARSRWRSNTLLAPWPQTRTVIYTPWVLATANGISAVVLACRVR
jgi:hypothetical protein